MNKLLAILLLVMLLVPGCAHPAETPAESGLAPQTPAQITKPPPQPPPPQPAPESELAKTAKTEQTKRGYKYVTEKPTGWFKTGQEADIVLYATGFNESGGPLVLNHPGKVATDGRRLIVADTWNNRVLIWNEMPARDNEPPDLVLGQPDFRSNVASLGADGMNWPMGVATDGNKLVVADANNHRVLIWNEFPQRNGEPADLVLGAPDFDTWPRAYERELFEKTGQRPDPKTRVYWPWDVWTDGTRLAVVVADGSSILIWNSLPTRNNQPADLIVRDEAARVNPERGIASDGRHLVATSYNENTIYIWNKFPDKDNAPISFRIDGVSLGARFPSENIGDFIFGVDLVDNRLLVTVGHKILIWDPFLQSPDEDPLIVGADRTRDEIFPSPDRMQLCPSNFNFPCDVASDGRRLIVADTGNSRVLIYNEIPTVKEAEADVILGTPEIFASRSCFVSGVAPFSDGEKLIVGADGYGVWTYNRLPDESRAPADIVLGNFPEGRPIGGPAITVGEKLIMVHREGSSVFIWNRLPQRDHEPPDIVLGSSGILGWGEAGGGRIGMNHPSSVTSDGKRLFVADSGNNRILVWNEIPTENQTPADIVIGQPDFEATKAGTGLDKFAGLAQISTDGKRLAAADQENHRVLIWNEIPTRNGQPADFEIKVINHSGEGDWTGEHPAQARLGLPGGVCVKDDKLFIADTDNNRVLIWNRFPETEMVEPDIVLGQKDFETDYPSNARDGLFIPYSVSFDGSFLWVGETKWSYRLLRFSVQPVK